MPASLPEPPDGECEGCECFPGRAPLHCLYASPHACSPGPLHTDGLSDTECSEHEVRHYYLLVCYSVYKVMRFDSDRCQVVEWNAKADMMKS